MPKLKFDEKSKRKTYNTERRKQRVSIFKKRSTLFLIPPFVVTLVSVMHLFDLFKIGNGAWLAALLAASFELIAIIDISLSDEISTLGKGAKWLSWVIVFMLFIILSTGNIYASFKVINDNDITVVSELTTLPNNLITKRVVAIFLGGPITILALSFIPMYVSYIRRIK